MSGWCSDTAPAQPQIRCYEIWHFYDAKYGIHFYCALKITLERERKVPAGDKKGGMLKIDTYEVKIDNYSHLKQQSKHKSQTGLKYFQKSITQSLISYDIFDVDYDPPLFDSTASICNWSAGYFSGFHSLQLTELS